MLYRLHSNIFIVGLLTLGFLITLSPNRAYSIVTLFTVFSFVTQLALLVWFSHQQDISFSERNLFLTVLVYSLLLGGLIITISYFFYGGEKFLFEDPDAVFYYKEGMKSIELGLFENIKRIITTCGFDDWSALLFSSIMLSIIPSFFFVNAFYILIGAISAVMLFRIGKCIMEESYAFLAALAYGTTSYIVMFHCTFLKETLFVFCVICTIYFFNKFILEDTPGAIMGVIISLVLVVFFRPAVAAFLILSIVSYYAVTKRGRAVSLFLYLMIAVGMVVSMAFLQSQMDHYTEGGDTDELLAENGSANYSGGFNYFVGWFVSLFGPFPTLFPTESLGPRNMNFYGAGLMQRLFLIIPLWTGVYYAIKHMKVQMIPMMAFTLVEMAATGFIMASFELRKVLLHIPFTYIIAFYGLYQLEKSKVSERNKKVLDLAGYALAISTLFLWNVIRVK